MIIVKKHLSRRTFLRGTFGASLALPFMDAMVPALTAQSRTAGCKATATSQPTISPPRTCCSHSAISRAWRSSSSARAPVASI